MTVAESDETLRIRVVDDGRGFDPAAPSDGFGLVGMRERINLAGGTLELKSAPGEGTAILADLPARYRNEPSGGNWPGSGTAPPAADVGEPAAGSG